MNLLLFLFAVWGTVYSFLHGGFAMLRFYTVLSNIIGLVAAGTLAAVQLFALLAGKRVPYFARMLKYIATVCLTLTFLVVVCILAPAGGAAGFRHMFLDGAFLFQHLLCPVLCFVSFCFLEGKPALGRKAVSAALVPTVLYAAVIYPLNIFRVIAGPYPFLLVYARPVWQTLLYAVLIFAGNYLLAAVIRRLGNRK